MQLLRWISPLAFVAFLVGCDDPVPPPRSYTFRVIAALGDAVGDGGVFTNDFEPNSINARGDIAFLADLTLGNTACPGCEGVYVWRDGRMEELARPGMAAPGGGVFAASVVGKVSVNEGGDVAFTDSLEPPAMLINSNSGLYRLSRRTGVVTVVARTGVPAPGGGAFDGAGLQQSINNLGVIAFTGTIPAEVGPGRSVHLGQGLFLADANDHLSAVVRPGDPAPGGDTFDWLANPWINDAGDIVFGGHIVRDECIEFNMTVPPAGSLFCTESVYVRRAGTTVIQSIAHLNEPAPGGGVFSDAYAAGINARGDIAFFGVVGAPGTGPFPPDNRSSGAFVHTNNRNIAVARPGDAMPGGGHLQTVGFFTFDMSINDAGDVFFSATLNTDDNRDNVRDSGLYVWSHGVLRVVARTGTVVPGVGTIRFLGIPSMADSISPYSGAASNGRGQIVFQATMTNGRDVLLLATPP